MEPRSISSPNNLSMKKLTLFLLLVTSPVLAEEPPKAARQAVEQFFPKEAGTITILEAAQSAGVWYLYVDQSDPESASQVIFSYSAGKLSVVYGDEPMFLPEPPPVLASAVSKDVLRHFIRAWAQRLLVKLGATKFQAETQNATGITKEVISSLN